MRKLIIMAMLLGCGQGIDRVETIRGPQGEPGSQGVQGIPGEPGQQGKDGKDAPIPPTPPTAPINNDIVIIVNGQPPRCPSEECPAPMMLVCACIDKQWKTIMIPKSDQHKYQIKHAGACVEQKQAFVGLCGYKRTYEPVPAPKEPTQC